MVAPDDTKVLLESLVRDSVVVIVHACYAPNRGRRDRALLRRL
jgi:hypothetical protein